MSLHLIWLPQGQSISMVVSLFTHFLSKSCNFGRISIGLTEGLDHEWMSCPDSGHVFLDKGVIYYSPNCSCQIKVPPKSMGYFFHPSKDVLSDYLEPTWWSPLSRYVVFITAIPLFNRLMFGVLHNIVSHIQCSTLVDGQTEQYYLDVAKVNDWTNLETKLLAAVAAMKQRIFHSYAFLSPPPQSMLSFSKKYPSCYSAILHILRSRDWFAVLIACVSFAIA